VNTYHSSKVCGALSLISALALACSSQSASALGITLPDQDAFATARGNAFVATADDPAAVFYNPAGISQLDGRQISVGAYGIVYSDTYRNGSAKIDSKTQLAVLPQVFSSWSFPKYNLTFGLGTYSPYGLRMEWPATAPFAGLGETGQINYYTLNPVVAYQLLPSLSIAAGPTFNYSEADLKEFPGFVNHFRGRDTAAGYTAGILWHPTPRNSLGISYRSSTDMNYQGHATLPVPPFTGNVPATANFHFPQNVKFGYSFRPTTNWNFEADADWSDWSTLRTVTVSPLGEEIPFNWRPSWILEAGVTRYLGDGWRVSGGYMYSMNTVPETDFNPLIPDSDRHIFSLGVGKKCGHFSYDIAYQLAWGPSRTINDDSLGSPPYPSSPANGHYTFLSHAITINLGYHF
jgi:long-chain fatty acid transport protein